MHSMTPQFSSLTSIKPAQWTASTIAASVIIILINQYYTILGQFPKPSGTAVGKRYSDRLYYCLRRGLNKLITMSESRKINPELSVLNEKNQLKKVETNVDTMKNRVELLRLQLQKEKDGVKKHKQLTKQTIQKKMEVNKIQQWKDKDNSDEAERIEYLRRRNQDLRASHEKELQDIQKAIYLVKLDDAREVKNISQKHNEKLKEMQHMFLSVQRDRKRKVAEESVAAKERYMKYWKDKLANIYTEQAHTIIEVGKQKEDKKKELQNLEQEEIKLMEEINKYHSQGVQTKKQYLAALSLPVKEVAEAMGNSKNTSMISRRQSMTINSSAVVDQNETARYTEKEGPKLPNAQVNQDKLKIILQQLKKIDRSAIHSSR